MVVLLEEWSEKKDSCNKSKYLLATVGLILVS